MFAAVYLFFTDLEYFRATLGSLRCGNRLRGLVGSAGVAVLTGIVPLSKLSETLGDVGWWIGAGLICAAFFLRSGDNTLDVLTNLTPEKAQALREQLRAAGVLRTEHEIATTVVQAIDPRTAAQVIEKAANVLPGLLRR
jgi:hypothetical protein